MTIDTAELEKQIQAKLRGSFLATAQDRLDTARAAFERFVSESPDGGDDSLHVMSRAIHELKGMGSSFGFPSITLIASRVYEVLRTRERPSVNAIAALAPHIDLMAAILAKGDDPGVAATERQLGA